MSIAGMAALFGAMALLAAVPSVSVLTVAARSASGGFAHGVATTAGVVAGDIVFIVVAIFGLSMLAEAMGGWFSMVRYAGAAYLVWFGLRLWRSAGRSADAPRSGAGSLRSSFLAGLLLTLADQKAILFYLGFFPAFVDIAAITAGEAATVMLIAALAVGGVKLVYAWLAGRAGGLLAGRANRLVGRAAGGVMVGVGVFLAAKG